MCALLAMITMTTDVRAQHEYAPLEEKEINYKNWTYKELKTNTPVNLRERVQGKKLVMVVYFAPWCGNWKYEAPVVARLYDKYKADGFDVIAVSEYAPAADTIAYFGTDGAPYTVVVESESRDAREKTDHYACRMKTGDTRRFGSPYNVFIEPAKIATTGDVLIKKTTVVNGELIEEEAEKFIRERLGVKDNAPMTNKLGASPSTVNKTVEVADKIYTMAQVTRKAKITDVSYPLYTEDARWNQVSGKVVLEVALMASGEVGEIKVIKGLPYGLTEQCIAAARKMKFEPAIKDGRPVSQYIRSVYSLNLH